MADSAKTTLEPLFAFLALSLGTLQDGFDRIPGSAVVLRYIKSSHQNDPGRTILELILAAFAIRTLLQSRTRADRTDKHFIKFSEKEVDELVDEWTPELLGAPLDGEEKYELAAVPIVSGPVGPKPKLLNTGKTAINLASLNFTGLAGNEHIKGRAVETLRKYGLGSCGPPGFYGTLDVHMELERDIAEFLGSESAILYSQGFSTISSVIPAFAKRGDIIVADRGVNFVIQKGIQISRSTVRWFDHNDLKSLEDVLESVDRERRKKKWPLTRRFIITEGIFEKDGAMVDLPKLIELKFKHKYRLILDESYSFGTVGRTGRGLTELYNVPAEKIDILVGSVAIGLGSAGGFCAGFSTMVEHQRINGPSFVYSASMPACLAVSGSEGINVLRNNPTILTSLQENIRSARAILDKLDCITIPSHPASPIIHIHIRPGPAAAQANPNLHPNSANHLSLLSPGITPTSSTRASNPQSILPREAALWDWDVEAEERLLQQVVDEALVQGVMITKAKRLRGQELVEARPSIKLAMTSALSKKDTEKAVNVVKAALVKVLGRRR